MPVMISIKKCDKCGVFFHCASIKAVHSCQTLKSWQELFGQIPEAVSLEDKGYEEYKKNFIEEQNKKWMKRHKRG